MIKTEREEVQNVPRAPSSGGRGKASIFARKNRGMLLDISVFLANVFLMGLLLRLFLDLFRSAAAGDALAKIALLFFYSGMLILPALGAVLKRWRFHQRIRELDEKEREWVWMPIGCFFIPAAYLVVNMTITLEVALIVLDFYPDTENGFSISSAVLLFGIVYNVFQTFLVFRYFSAPKRAPASNFLRSPRAEVLGDACVFLNLISYQVLFNYAALSHPVFHEGKFVDRFFTTLIFAVLMYLAGRIFFLVEDLRRPRTILTILLANTPLVLRVLLLNK